MKGDDELLLLTLSKEAEVLEVRQDKTACDADP